MSRLCPLFSSSSGNSTYISSAGCGILIDAGASFKGIAEALEMAGGSFSELAAVAVTHEHTDHTKGLKTLLKKTGLPLVASQKTLEALEVQGLIPPENEVIVADGGEVAVGSLAVSRFATSHDCEGSSGYTVTLPSGERVAVCTDLGVVTDEVRAALLGCSTVLFESNHDVEMLRRGPYPAHLKLRILSDSGHLSNSACAVELPQLLRSGCRRFILGHLSQHNNLPALAIASSKAVLADFGAKANEDYILTAAKPKGNEAVLF